MPGPRRRTRRRRSSASSAPSDRRRRRRLAPRRRRSSSPSCSLAVLGAAGAPPRPRRPRRRRRRAPWPPRWRPRGRPRARRSRSSASSATVRSTSVAAVPSAGGARSADCGRRLGRGGAAAPRWAAPAGRRVPRTARGRGRGRLVAVGRRCPALGRRGLRDARLRGPCGRGRGRSPRRRRRPCRGAGAARHRRSSARASLPRSCGRRACGGLAAGAGLVDASTASLGGVARRRSPRAVLGVAAVSASVPRRPLAGCALAGRWPGSAGASPRPRPGCAPRQVRPSGGGFARRPACGGARAGASAPARRRAGVVRGRGGVVVWGGVGVEHVLGSLRFWPPGAPGGGPRPHRGGCGGRPDSAGAHPRSLRRAAGARPGRGGATATCRGLVSIGGQRVTDRPVLVERSLRHAHRDGRARPGRDRRRRAARRDVVGSDGRGHLPDDQCPVSHAVASVGPPPTPAATVDRQRRRPAASTSRRPSLVSRSTEHLVARQEAPRRPREPVDGRRPGSSMRQCEACIRSASDPGPGRRRPRRCPGRRAARRRARARTASGSRLAGQADLEVLGLAGHAGRRGADVADLRVRAEPGRVGHRHLGAAQRPLEGAGEVAVRGEPQPPALGVAHPQPLHDRRRRRAFGDSAGHRGPGSQSPAPRRAAAPCG